MCVSESTPKGCTALIASATFCLERRPHDRAVSKGDQLASVLFRESGADQHGAIADALLGDQHEERVKHVVIVAAAAMMPPSDP